MDQFNSPLFDVRRAYPCARRSPVRLLRAVAVACTLLACVAGRAAAESDDYSQYLHWTSMVRGDDVGQYKDVTLAGDLLYAARAAGGVQILSLDDPAKPEPLGEIVLPGDALEIAVDGDYAYVAADTAGLQVLDCSNPAHPAILAALELIGPAQGVTLDGSTLYVCCADSGVVAVDVGTPAAPVAGLFADTPGTAYRAVRFGDYIAVADVATGVQFVTPADMQIVGAVDTPGMALSVTTDGDLLYVADYFTGLVVIDVPTVETAEIIGTRFSSPGVFDVAVGGDLAVLANLNAGVVTVDVSDPTAPTIISGLCGSDLGYGVALGEEYVYLADMDDLNTYFLGDGDTVPLLDTFYLDELADIAIGRDHLFAVDGARLWVLDRDDGSVVGSGATLYDPRELALGDGYAYVADGGAGVRAVDLADLEAPRVEPAVYVGGETRSLAFHAGHIFAAVANLGLVTLDAASPGAPVIEGFCGLDGEINALTASGDTVFVAAGSRGLWSVDVSEPSAPVVLDNLYTGHDLEALSVIDDRICAISEECLVIFDVSDPADLSLDATYELRGPLADVAVTERTAYVVDPYIGLYVIDISDPAAPVVIGGGIRSSFFIRAVDASADKLFVADGYGIFLMPLHAYTTGIETTPAPLTRLHAAPNPFNPRVTLSFTLEAAGPVRLEVFDLLGRRVAVPAAGLFRAGDHAVAWDGRDADGRDVAAGVYMGRLTSSAGVCSAKMALVR